MAASLRMRLFGEPALVGSQGMVALRTTRQLGILVYGLLEGPRVRRDRLVPLFWPDAPEKRGRHSLTQALSELRAAVPGVVASERGHVVVRNLASDLDDLEREPGSVERGQVLEGLDGLGGVELAQWLDAARERVRLEGVRRLERALQAAPDRAARLLAARAMVRLDPTHEQAVIVLAEEDLDAERPTDAVRRLRRQQERVRADLGDVPQPRVAALLRRLERGDAQRARDAILGDPVRLDTAPEPIVGREAEEAALARAWDEVCGGARRSVQISGAPGMGKSQFVRAFLAALAGRGHPAFLVTCHPATRGVPFALLADVADALAADPGFGAAEPRWLAEVSRIHPVLRSRFPGIPEPADAPPESIRERLVEATTAILATIADGGPVALAVDDADQGDSASLSVLRLVVRRVHQHPLLVVTAGGEGERAEEEDRIRSDRRIGLGRLPDAVIRELLERRARAQGDQPVEPAVLERIAKLAEGNPYYALSLFNDHESHQLDPGGPVAVSWTPPQNLVEAIGRAVTQHSRLARHVLSALATAGTGVALPDLQGVTGLSDADFRAATIELLAHERIRVVGNEAQLASPLWSSAIYAREPDAARRYLHQCWADLLLANVEMPETARLPAAARHEALAGRHEEALRHFQEGAAAALKAGAAKEALAALEEALRLPIVPDALTWSLLAEGYFVQGRYGGTLKALASADTARGGDTIARQQNALLQVEALQRSGTASPSVLRSALRGIEQGKPNRSVTLRTLQVRAEIARQDGDLEELTELSHAVRVFTPISTPERATGNLTKAFLLWQLGQVHASHKVFRQAFEELRDLRLLHQAIRAANGAGITACGAAKWIEAFGHFRAGIELAIETGNRDQAAAVLTNAAITAEQAGSLEDAVNLTKAAQELVGPLTANARHHTQFRNEVDFLLELGRIEDASRMLALIENHGPNFRDTRSGAQLYLSRSALALARGDTETAVARILKLPRLFKSRQKGLDYYMRSDVILHTCVGHILAPDKIQPWDMWEGRHQWTAVGRVAAVVFYSMVRRSSQTLRSIASRLRPRLALNPFRWILHIVEPALTSAQLPSLGVDRSLVDSLATKATDLEVETALRELVDLVDAWRGTEWSVDGPRLLSHVRNPRP